VFARPQRGRQGTRLDEATDTIVLEPYDDSAHWRQVKQQLQVCGDGMKSCPSVSTARCCGGQHTVDLDTRFKMAVKRKSSYRPDQDPAEGVEAHKSSGRDSERHGCPLRRGGVTIASAVTT